MHAIFTALFVAACVAIYLIRRYGVADQLRIRIDRMPDVVAQLRTTGKDMSFAVFRFAAAGEPPEGEHLIDLQFSVEGNVLGLDWTLLSPRNIADKDRIAAFIRGRHQAVNEREMNGVRYLRVEDGDLAELGAAIARDVYGLAPLAECELIVDGFDWPAR